MSSAKWILIAIMILGVVAFTLFKGGQKEMMGLEQKKVFQSQLGAMGWYPNDNALLDVLVDSCIENADQDPIDKIKALILPHAGYRYSGVVAGHGAKAIKGKKYSRVVILGLSHQIYLPNKASVMDMTHLQTPLGEVPLDIAFIKRLRKSSLFTYMPKVHDSEHSVQIEIPFLQKTIKDLKIVPIVFGSLDQQTTKKMAEVILELIDEETLVVVSSDFVHYGDRFDYVPFSVDIEQNIEQLDMQAYSFIEKKDSDGFMGMCQETGATICGKAPVAVLLAMLSKEMGVHLLSYDTSGSLTGDWQNSVSYMSIAFTGDWNVEKNMKEEKKVNNSTLSAADKKNLLKLARKTVEYYLVNQIVPTPEVLGVAVSEGMGMVMGAFVTLHKNGQLRGCIGEIVPIRALYKAVIEQAVNAAVNDHRFSPVGIDDVPSLDFEISALTPPYQIDSYQDFEIGKHGVILEKAGRSAVFLPQVAPEQGWDVAMTLTQLALKAGLSQNAWKTGASFYVFEAIVFSE
jgi:MEMO1 family protein